MYTYITNGGGARAPARTGGGPRAAVPGSGLPVPPKKARACLFCVFFCHVDCLRLYIICTYLCIHLVKKASDRLSFPDQDWGIGIQRCAPICRANIVVVLQLIDRATLVLPLTPFP